MSQGDVEPKGTVNSESEMDAQGQSTPSLIDVILPILVLAGSLTALVFAFDVDAGVYTPAALILAAIAAALVGVKNGYRWAQIEEGIAHTISSGLKAILILLCVGGLIGSWMLSGTVPAMIYYGGQLLSPEWFYPTAALVCAVTAWSIGSSWTVAGALGVAFIGISEVMGLSLAVTAGAVISGAYLGDKLSPLSDTTNLAAGVTGNNLFRHIRHMGWTTLPAFAIALIVFAVVGVQSAPQVSSDAMIQMRQAISDNFSLGVVVFLPLVLLFAMSLRKAPVLPTLLLGIVAGIAVALIFQPQQVSTLGGGESFSLLKGSVIAVVEGFSIDSGVPTLDNLLSKGGLTSMLGTVLLILTALSFGGVFESVGLLKRGLQAVLSGVKSVGGLIAAALATSFGTNVVCSDQYISIVVPGRMFRTAFIERGVHPLNLSRAIEDAGTLTSVLVPWNTCGLFMAGTLGVLTWDYAPWAILCWLSPLISLLFGYLSFKVLPLEEGTLELKEAQTP